MSTLGTILAFALLTGCGPSDPAGIIEDGKVTVTGEQVAVTADQVLCGEEKGLWKVEQVNGGGLARLTPEARSLGFADDIVMGNMRFRDPFAQISGDRKLKVAKVTTVTDDDSETKSVTAAVGVIIKHACFENPLPLHGVESGAFSQDAETRVRIRNNKVEILH